MDQKSLANEVLKALEDTRVVGPWSGVDSLAVLKALLREIVVGKKEIVDVDDAAN